MKLSTKLSLAMGSLALIIALSNMFSIWQLDKVNAVSQQLSYRWIPSIVAIEEMNTLLSTYRVSEIQHSVATDDAEMSSYEKRMDDTKGKFIELMKIYEAFPLSAEMRRLFDDLKTNMAEFDRLHIAIAAASRLNETEKAFGLLNGASRDIYYRMGAILMQSVKLNIDAGRNASTEGDVTFTTASNSLIGILVGSLLISILVLVVIVRSTLAQLGKDPGALGSIAQRVTEGDYNIADGSPRIGVYGNIVGMVEALRRNIDAATAASQQAAEESNRALEAKQSAEAASAMAQSKTEAILVAADKLEEVANVVSSASAELSAQIEQSERGAAEQAARVGETATAMEEMNSTVLEVARNASQASEVSASTRSKAEAGAGVVQKAVESIQEVQRQSLVLKGDMVTLGENAQSINQIMGVISDIADQTNLLALNAAIEAARAGDAGRGFAVVADEVRKLAEKTMVSTTDVGNAIRAIQNSASKSMVQVDAAVTTIEQATEYANQSGKALAEIVNMVDRTADQVRAIATASEQQSASSEEINQSITQVNTIASETARAMQEAAQAVSDLAHQAAVLTRLIEDMKKG